MESNNRFILRYFKCSNCQRIDKILLPPSIKKAKCEVCNSLFKEISESEFKEKKKQLNEYIEKTKKENNRQRGNPNPNRINNNRNEERMNRANRNRERNYEEEENNNNRGNSLLHYSRMNINNMNDINDNNHNSHVHQNNNNINFNNRNNINKNYNNNRNRNQNNNSNHHHHHNQNNIRDRRNNNQNNRRRRDNSSERQASNNIIEQVFGNILRPISSRPMMIINPNRNRNPFRIVIQRQNVPQDIFDPFFSNFGSVFNGAFQDNYSSNFRSNYRGNFMNEILRILEQNQNEARRQQRQHHPTSNENLNKLKQFKMSEKYCKKEGEGKLELPNCCICIEEIAIGQKTILLPCGHMFHNDCIVTWLKKNNTCPMCRFEIK